RRANIYAKMDEDEDKVAKRAADLLKNIGEMQFKGITPGRFKYELKRRDIKQKDIVDDLMEESSSRGITLNGTIKRYKEKVEVTDSFGKDIRIQNGNTELNLNGRKSYVGAYSRVYENNEKIQAKEAVDEIEKFADIKPNWVDFQGKLDVVLLPMASSVLFSMLAQAASAFDILNHESFLVDKLNTEIASKDVSVQDRFDGPEFSPFDDENTKSSNFYIVKDGMLLELLHNNTTADIMKAKNHGNAGIVSGQPRNIFVDNGDLSYYDLLNKSDRCIVVNNLWYTRFNNVLKGDYSTMPKDAVLLVERGTVKGTIKNLRISDNILNQLKNIIYLGNDGRYVKSWEVEIPTHAPSVMLKDVNFTKSY
ncbi:MAG: TldD/PmbA family protein, partial [Candidatus Parvarchaeota archaeon]|nr:TldD/PmbA family protein [Candidatus Parvarchaeota archaeon]